MILWNGNNFRLYALIKDLDFTTLAIVTTRLLCWWTLHFRNGPTKNGDNEYGSDVHKKTSKYTSSKQDILADNNESEGRQLTSRGEKQRQKVD